jgi:hypothetical protein
MPHKASKAAPCACRVRRSGRASWRPVSHQQLLRGEPSLATARKAFERGAGHTSPAPCGRALPSPLATRARNRNETEPLADDDWQFAAKTIARRPVNDLLPHPAINQHPFGPRLDGDRGLLQKRRSWGDRLRLRFSSVLPSLGRADFDPGHGAGRITPRRARSSLALARRSARQAVQQLECSQAWREPHPTGSKGASGVPGRPHSAQRSGGVSGWVASRCSTRTMSNATRSASECGRPRICMTRATWSSKAPGVAEAATVD